MLHKFGRSGDGRFPTANLIYVDGMLYGTTLAGGRGPRSGIVFEATLAGKDTVLHSFGKGDGLYPAAPLVDRSGTLYGTTQQGGAYQCGGSKGCGTVFSLNLTTGAEKVLHSFGSGSDGDLPTSGLTYASGRLYGTTFGGGSYNTGTVFSITLNGKERIVHSFAPTGGDGLAPAAGLLYMKGILYGTTPEGGSYGHSGIQGPGTVFNFDPATGAETVLHSFGNDGDGAAPVASLVALDGILYGTTAQGGANSDGVVFSITTSGYEHVLYSFGATGDGEHPVASLENVNGILYGTTAGGGLYDCGTIFSITTSGTENVIHSFARHHDGCVPAASPVFASGALYGTTEYGGRPGGLRGSGTIYSITL